MKGLDFLHSYPHGGGEAHRVCSQVRSPALPLLVGTCSFLSPVLVTHQLPGCAERGASHQEQETSGLRARGSNVQLCHHLPSPSSPRWGSVTGVFPRREGMSGLRMSVRCGGCLAGAKTASPEACGHSTQSQQTLAEAITCQPGAEHSGTQSRSVRSWIGAGVEGQVVCRSRCDPSPRGLRALQHTLGASQARTVELLSPELSVLTPQLHCPGPLDSKLGLGDLALCLSLCCQEAPGTLPLMESPSCLSPPSGGHHPAAGLSPQPRKAPAAWAAP